MRRSLKITVVIAIIASFLGFMLSSSASAKSSAKEQARQAIGKVLPYKMPNEVKKAVQDIVADPTLVVNKVGAMFQEYNPNNPSVPGPWMNSTFAYDASGEWVEVSRKVIKQVSINKKTSFFMDLTSTDRLVYGYYSYSSNSQFYVGDEWTGTPMPLNTSVNWMGKKKSLTMSYITVATNDSNYPMPEYYYPGEK